MGSEFYISTSDIVNFPRSIEVSATADKFAFKRATDIVNLR